MSLPVYTNGECTLVVNELKKHVNGEEVFSLEEPNIGLGITITKDLGKKMYRQSYYKDCMFDSTVCKGIGFSGSRFIDTVFRSCDLNGGNLRSCDFNSVAFLDDGEKRYPMVNAGFHKGTFTECAFQNLYIFSCGFTDMVFYNTTFVNCIIRLCSLENAQFQNCYFIGADISTLNLGYAGFDDIRAIQTIFPFITIPSAYGLLQQLSLSDSSNTVYAAADETHKLSVSEYYALLRDFECYYTKEEKYYALANLYISQDMVMGGYKVIRAGIMKAVKTKDSRTLRHLCELVYLSDISTIRQRHDLFENTMKWVSNENLSLPKYHNYRLFAGHIREILLNNDSHKSTLYFYLEANIESGEPQKQVVLLTIVDGILTSCNVPSTSIEMRHNPVCVDFLTIICENIPQLSQVLIMIYGSLAGVTLITKGVQKLVETGQTAVSSYDQHKLNRLEPGKKKIEVEILKQEQNYKKTMESIDYEKSLTGLRELTLEVEEMEKQAGEYRKTLMDNGIEISVRHNSKDLENAPFYELIHYNQ